MDWTLLVGLLLGPELKLELKIIGKISRAAGFFRLGNVNIIMKFAEVYVEGGGILVATLSDKPIFALQLTKFYPTHAPCPCFGSIEE